MLSRSWVRWTGFSLAAIGTLQVSSYLAREYLPTTSREPTAIAQWSGQLYDFTVRGSPGQEEIFAVGIVKDAGFMKIPLLGESSDSPDYRALQWTSRGWNQIGPTLKDVPISLFVWDSVHGRRIVISSEKAHSNVSEVLVLQDNAWKSLARVDGFVTKMTCFREELVIYGSFTAIDGVVAGGIASWNGERWSVLDGGVQRASRAAVRCAIPRAGELIIGGLFDHAGGVAARNIASWDGSSWSTLGPGLPGSSPSGGYVNRIVVCGSGIEVIGEFDNPQNPGGLSSWGRWENGDWSETRSTLGGRYPGQNEIIAIGDRRFVCGDLLGVSGGAYKGLLAWKPTEGWFSPVRWEFNPALDLVSNLQAIPDHPEALYLQRSGWSDKGRASAYQEVIYRLPVD